MLTFDCYETIYKTQNNFKMHMHYFTLILRVTDSLEVMCIISFVLNLDLGD